MISRVWHGWTTRENADAYEKLLRTEIFHGIAQRAIQDYRGIHLLRRDVQEGVEFVTIMSPFIGSSPPEDTWPWTSGNRYSRGKWRL